jgi:hypothetical protein
MRIFLANLFLMRGGGCQERRGKGIKNRAPN